MSKPDAQEFARVVLWRLAGIEAAMIQLENKAIAEMAQGAGDSHEQVGKRWAERKQKMRLDYYQEALEAAGIPQIPEDPDQGR